MTAPGDVVGQAVVNVRTCQFGWPCGENYNDPTRCPGCRGDGTYRAEEVTTVDEWGAWLTQERDGKPWCNHNADEWCASRPEAHVRLPMWRERPVENGDTGDGAA